MSTFLASGVPGLSEWRQSLQSSRWQHLQFLRSTSLAPKAPAGGTGRGGSLARSKQVWKHLILCLAYRRD